LSLVYIFLTPFSLPHTLSVSFTLFAVYMGILRPKRVGSRDGAVTFGDEILKIVISTISLSLMPSLPAQTDAEHMQLV
jgi:hypothetical protein